MHFLATLLPLAAAIMAVSGEETFSDLERRHFHLPRKAECAPQGAAHFIVTSEFHQLPHGYGTMGNIMNMVKQQLPASTNYSVPYPKQNNATSQAVQTAKRGARNFRKYFKWYADQCPDGPIIVLGYSEGALITTNGLCGRSHIGSPDTPPLPAKYGPRVAAVALWGDPTFVAGEPWDQGTCTSGGGQNQRQTPSNCDAFSSGMQSWCVYQDPVCCRGTDYSYHFIYQQQYVQQTYDAVIQAYQSWATANNW